MRTLTGPAQTKALAATYQPATVLEIDVNGGSTLYLSDRAITVEGQDYEALVEDWGDIDALVAADFMTRDDVRIAILNRTIGGLAFSQYFMHYRMEGSQCRIKKWFVGLDAADLISLFVGAIAGPVVYDEQRVALDIVDISARIEGKIGNLVNLTDFPDALKDHVGRMIPIVYGDTPQVPCLKLVSAATSKLYGTILATETGTLTVEDGADFTAGAITIIVDEEEITGSFSGDTFTITARGAGGTTAVDHISGADVIEKITKHVYIANDYPSKLVDNIRCEGQAVSGSTINKNDTATFPGLGRAITTISFTTKPKIKHFERSTMFLGVNADAVDGSNSAQNAAYAYDQIPTTFATVNKANPSLRVKQTTNMSVGDNKYGEIISAKLLVEYFQNKKFTNDSADAYFDANNLGALPTAQDAHTDVTGETDVIHGHTHQLAPDHTHTIPVKFEAARAGEDWDFINVTVGVWDFAGSAVDGNFQTGLATFTPATNGSCRYFRKNAVNKGAITRVKFGVAAGPTDADDEAPWDLMEGKFTVAWIRNGVQKWSASFYGPAQDVVSAWQTIPGLVWSDFNNANTYWKVTPDTSYNTANGKRCRIRELWTQIEYVESPISGTDKATADVNNYSGAPIELDYGVTSSETVVKGFDLASYVGQDWSQLNNALFRVDYVDGGGADDGVNLYVSRAWVDVEFVPYRWEALDNITADVQGIEDAGDGTGTLIENPALVIKNVITNLLGLAAGTYVDATSFSAAQSDLTSASYAFAGVIGKQIPSGELLAKLAMECRCRFFWEVGKAHLIYREATYGSGDAVADITEDEIRLGSVGTRGGIDSQPFRVQNGPSGGVENHVSIHYAYNHAAAASAVGDIEELYDGVKIAEDGDSQSDYGTKKAAHHMDFIRADALGQDLADFYLARRKRPQRLASFSLHMWGVQFERGDIVRVRWTWMGIPLWPAEILQIVHQPGSGSRGSMPLFAVTAELQDISLVIVEQFTAGCYIVRDLFNDIIYYFIDDIPVARIDSDGEWRIAGFWAIVGAGTLDAGDPADFQKFDAANKVIYYSDDSGTRLLEIDSDGNMRILKGQTANVPQGALGTHTAMGIALIGSTVKWTLGGSAPDYNVVSDATDDFEGLRYKGGGIAQNASV